MAAETKRHCGYRKVGALYLVGNYIPVSCDRLPLEVGHCPVCGSGIHFTRSMAEINPYRLWGVHKPCFDSHSHFCNVCQPPIDVAFIMMVGERYYSPESFLQEAIEVTTLPAKAGSFSGTNPERSVRALEYYGRS
jgi:hypothetical protein